jgi:hypothetical protein
MRDVDRLDPLPDGRICEQDHAYLVRPAGGRRTHHAQRFVCLGKGGVDGPAAKLASCCRMPTCAQWVPGGGPRSTGGAPYRATAQLARDGGDTPHAGRPGAVHDRHTHPLARGRSTGVSALTAAAQPCTAAPYDARPPLQQAREGAACCRWNTATLLAAAPAPGPAPTQGWSSAFPTCACAGRLQDPKTGLPQHRQAKLEKVFKIIDRAGSGRLAMRSLQVRAYQPGGCHSCSVRWSSLGLRGACSSTRCAHAPRGAVCAYTMQSYANSHGGETLTNADLRALFQ